MVRNLLISKAYIWLIVLAFSSCLDNKEESLTSASQEFNDSLEVVVESLEVKEPEHFKKLTNQSVETVSNYPILLIQNCGALLPKKCELDVVINSDSVLQSVGNYFKNDSLISVGSKGILRQKLKEVFCMSGECHGNQLALKLKQEECFGVLMSVATYDALGPFTYVKRNKVENLIDTGLLRKLQLDSVKQFLQGKMYERSQFKRASSCNSRIFTNPTSTFVVQKAFFEYLEEGENFAEDAYYEGDRFQSEYSRLLVKKEDKWISLPWTVSTEPYGYWQPDVVAVSLKGDTLSQILYQSEGICCPSKSSLTLTTSVLSKDSLIHKVLFETSAGLGQPCD